MRQAAPLAGRRRLDAMLAPGGWVVVGVFLLAGCCGPGDEVSGTYVGTGRGRFQVGSEAPTDIGGPDDVVEVRQTSRHHDQSTIDVRVRGCTLRDSTGGKGDWTLEGSCPVERPGEVPLDVHVSGGLARTPGGVTLMISGRSPEVREFGYSIGARPRR